MSGEHDDERRDRLKIAIEDVGWGIQLLTKEVDDLRAAGDAMATELARWGWGDMHFSSSSPQERSVVDALAAWRSVRSGWEHDTPVARGQS